jgi:hypothetical protein
MTYTLIYCTKPKLDVMQLVNDPSDARMIVESKRELFPNNERWRSAKWTDVDIQLDF